MTGMTASCKKPGVDRRGCALNPIGYLEYGPALSREIHNLADVKKKMRPIRGDLTDLLMRHPPEALTFAICRQ